MRKIIIRTLDQAVLAGKIDNRKLRLYLFRFESAAWRNKSICQNLFGQGRPEGEGGDFFVVFKKILPVP